MPESKRGLQVPDPLDPAHEHRTNHALVIGIDFYADERITNLANPVSDCKELVDLLCNRFTFDPANIKTLYNEQANRKQIREAFISCITDLGPEDNLLIFYAGHGVWNEVLEWGYWVPAGARFEEIDDYLGNEEVVDLVEKINTHHTVFIADSCFSGDFFERKRSAFDQITGARSRWAISSGRLEAVSDDSPFFRHLMRVLTETDDDILVSDLANQVKIATASTSRSEQTPRGEPMMIDGHEGGEFLFRLRENVAVPEQRPDVESTYTEERSLEAALPQKMRVGEESLLTVLIRHHSQESLASMVSEDDKFGVGEEDVESEEFSLDFKRDSNQRILDVGLVLVLEASHFDLPITQRRVKVKPGKNSSLITFLCTPKKAGRLFLTLQVYYEEELIGSGVLQAQGFDQVLLDTDPTEERVSISLGSFSESSFQEGNATDRTKSKEEESDGADPDSGFESNTDVEEWKTTEIEAPDPPALDPHTGPGKKNLPSSPENPQTPDAPTDKIDPADVGSKVIPNEQSTREDPSDEPEGEVSHMKGGCFSVVVLLIISFVAILWSLFLDL